MNLEDFNSHVRLFDETFECKWDYGTRLGLIIEELGEWSECILKNKSQQEAARELSDVLYVVLGAAHVAGYDLREALQYVVAKNQQKIENKKEMRISPQGKVVKPGKDQDEMVLQEYSSPETRRQMPG